MPGKIVINAPHPTRPHFNMLIGTESHCHNVFLSAYFSMQGDILNSQAAFVVCKGVGFHSPLCDCCLASVHSARIVLDLRGGVRSPKFCVLQRQPSFPFSHFDDKLCSDIRQGILDPLWVCKRVWMQVREHCGLLSQRTAVLRETDMSPSCQPHRSSHVHLHTLIQKHTHNDTRDITETVVRAIDGWDNVGWAAESTPGRV